MPLTSFSVTDPYQIRTAISDSRTLIAPATLAGCRSHIVSGTVQSKPTGPTPDQSSRAIKHPYAATNEFTTARNTPGVPSLRASVPPVMTDTMDGSQGRPSLDILDECAPDASLESFHKPTTPGFLRLKLPVWEKREGRAGTLAPGGIPRRSKRSQGRPVKGSQSHTSKPTAIQARSLDDDVSPTNSTPGTPRLASPTYVPRKQSPASTEPAPELCFPFTNDFSLSPAAELPMGQPVKPGPVSVLAGEGQGDKGLTETQSCPMGVEALERKGKSNGWLTKNLFRKISMHRGKDVTTQSRETPVKNLSRDANPSPDLESEESARQ